MLIPLVFLCCLGCQQGERAATVNVEADIQAIKDLITDHNDAVNSGDIDKASSYHADEIIVIPPNRPAKIGKTAALTDLQQMLEQLNLQEDYIIQHVQVNGDLAVAHGIYSGIYTPKAGGEPFKANGHIIDVCKKQSDGAWKLIYLTWSDEGLVRPPLSE